MIYLQLFYEFFKTGLFAVGGGMATLPFLYEMSAKMGWFTEAQLTDMIAVGECTPGPIGVNMATYAGFTTAGLPGAVIATLGLVTPCVIVILIIASFLERFRTNRLVEGAFYGLRPASTALITAAGLRVLQESFFPAELSLAALGWRLVALGAVLILLTRVVKKTKGLHPIVFIALSAAVGIAVNLA